MRRVGHLANVLYDLSLNMNERRSQPRLLDCELVMVSWQENSIRLDQLGNVQDMSLGGIGILVQHPPALGTPVTISYGHGELSGIVRHRAELIDSTFIGIEFDEASKGSTLHFQPELLVALG